jgi:uncharacterized membrane protein YeaQ/YmgE (transglycosylase-associated protein family)
MFWIWAIIVGLIVGLIAKLVIPEPVPMGCLSTALLGIAGSLIAKVLGDSIGWYRPGQPAGFLGSILGAIILLAIFRIIRGRPLP